MTYTATATRSSTTATTTTEARVRHVMGKVMANFNALVVYGLISQKRATKWHDDLTCLQLMDALATFQIQFGMNTSSPYCLNYVISNDGSVQQDSPSGGLDVYGIRMPTAVTLCVGLRPEKYQEARSELERRGWSFNGRLIEAPASESRTFSSGGYGITRSKRGNWP